MQDSSNRFTSRICAVSQWRGTDTAHHRAVEHTQRRDHNNFTQERAPRSTEAESRAPSLSHESIGGSLTQSCAHTADTTRHRHSHAETARPPHNVRSCRRSLSCSSRRARASLAATPCTRADAVHSRRGARVDALGVTCSGFITPGARNPRAPGSSRVRHASSRSVERELRFALVHQAIVAPAREHFAMHEPP